MNAPMLRTYTVAEVWHDEHPAQIQVQLGWRASDPYAVEMLFLVPSDDLDDVTWVVDRDLLAEGLHTPAGIGDIHIRPGAGVYPDCPVELTVVRLADASGWTSEIEFSTEDLSGFLEATYDQIPAGAEHYALDLDTEIEQLLREDFR